MEPLQRVLDEIEKYEHPFFDFSAAEKDGGVDSAYGRRLPMYFRLNTESFFPSGT